MNGEEASNKSLSDCNGLASIPGSSICKEDYGNRLIRQPLFVALGCDENIASEETHHVEKDFETLSAVKESDPKNCAVAITTNPESCEQVFTLEENISKRKRRLTSSCAHHVCPICGLTLRTGELEQHCTWELSRLSSVASTKSINRRLRKSSNHKSKQSIKKPKGAEEPDINPTEFDDEASAKHQENYKNIKKRRMERVANEMVRSVALTSDARETTDEDATVVTVFCPVCSNAHSGSKKKTLEELTECLTKSELEEEFDENDDEEDDEWFEEYTWAGQKRIRTTTLMQGNFHNIEGKTVMLQMADDNEEELDVDGNVEIKYGNSQYNESDIIPCNSECQADDEANKQIRQAMVGDAAPNSERENSKWGSDDTTKDSPVKQACLDRSLTDDEKMTRLKLKIAKLEERLVNESIRCLICMECYQTPLVSVLCWHVYCEECWMRALGAKKLCPKCNLITTANDLRRIYL